MTPFYQFPPSVPSPWSCTTSLPPFGAESTTPSMASCCASSPSSSQWAPASLWRLPTSCCPARTTGGGGGACLVPAPQASSSSSTRFSTTGTGPLWVAWCRVPSSSATLCSQRWSSRWCWAACRSGPHWLLFATSTVASRWTRHEMCIHTAHSTRGQSSFSSVAFSHTQTHNSYGVNGRRNRSRYLDLTGGNDWTRIIIVEIRDSLLDDWTDEGWTGQGCPIFMDQMGYFRTKGWLFPIRCEWVKCMRCVCTDLIIVWCSRPLWFLLHGLSRLGRIYSF